MRLTDEMRDEISKMNFKQEDQLESYKVKLENFYCQTDLKEQTFQDFQSFFFKFSQARNILKHHPERKIISVRCSYGNNDEAGSTF